MTIRRFTLSIALLFLILSIAVPMAAQSGDPGDGADNGAAEELQEELWCPICQGIRLDVCEQKVCEQMRDLIDTELAAGKSGEEIKSEFVDLYGPVVLGEPPREGFNLLAWIVPALLLVGGLIAAALIMRRWTQKPTPAAVTPDAPDDEYLARVERELSDQ